MDRAQKAKRIGQGIALAIFSYLFYRAIALLLLCWDKPWPVPALAIDGPFYLEGAQRIVWGESPFAMADIYHSPGYQWLLATLLKLTGTLERTYHLSKLLSLSLFFLSLTLTFRLGRRFFSVEVARLASFFLACSLSWLYYSMMIQYEVLVGFLLLWWLLAALEARPLRSGLLLAAIILIHAKFLALLLVPFGLLIQAWRNKKSIRVPIASLLITLVPLLAWSISQSLRTGEVVWILIRREFLFRLGNNPNALGTSYPYPEIVEPSGLAFVLAEPLHFLWLLGQRFLYLFGLKPDVWAIPPAELGRHGLEPLQALALLLLFAAGLFFSLRERVERWPLYVVLTAILLPSLLVFANHRMLVPLVPLLAIFQAHGLLRLMHAKK